MEAEQRAEACLRLGMEVGDADALGWYGAQLVAIRWFQGRSGEVLPTVIEMSQSTTVAELNHGFAAAIAALAAAAGDHDSARTTLASLRAHGLRSLPTCSTWMVTLLGVCEAAHTLHDVDAAAEAYELLEPFADLPAMASLGVACFGSAHRPLALAAWTIGDLDRAIGHLESALLADLALDHRPCHAIDAALLAEALDLRRQPGRRRPGERAVDDRDRRRPTLRHGRSGPRLGGRWACGPLDSTSAVGARATRGWSPRAIAGRSSPTAWASVT